MSVALRSDPVSSRKTAAGRRPVTVGLVQINNSFSGQNYLPYSVALLQTYVQKIAADPGRYRFLPPLYKRVRIADAVEALKAPTWSASAPMSGTAASRSRSPAA